VSVNGEWARQGPQVRSFLNPCLSDDDLAKGEAVAEAKGMSAPVRLLFVGRVEAEKGCGRVIELARDLRKRGTAVTLDIVGDGVERPRFEALAAESGLSPHVRFLGWLPRPELARLYSDAHFLVLPSVCSEGWPKVLSEGMAYGAIPLASTVSCIPQYLERFRTGRAFDAHDGEAFVRAIEWYRENPAEWRKESSRAAESARLFSYGNYLMAVRQLLTLDSARRDDESSRTEPASREVTRSHPS
jgi:glycosyltransferase involved in cell wall biosynthesis